MQIPDEQRIVLTVQEELKEERKGATKQRTGSKPLFYVTRQETGDASILPENNSEGLRFFWGQNHAKSDEGAINFPSWYTSPETPLPQIMDGSIRRYFSNNLMNNENVLLVSNGHDPATEWGTIIEMFEDIVTAKARASGIFSLSGALPGLASTRRRSSMDILFSCRCSSYGGMPAPTCRISCFEVTKENGLRDLTTGRSVMSTDIGRRRKDGVDIRRIADISSAISNAVRRRSERSHVVIVVTVGALVVELALLNSPAAPSNLDASRRTKGGVNTHIFTLLSVLKEIANSSSDGSAGSAHSIRSYRNSVLTNLLFSPFRGSLDTLKVAVFCKIINSCLLEDSARTMLHFAMDVQQCANICAANASASSSKGQARRMAMKKKRSKYVITMAGVRMRRSMRMGVLRAPGVEPPRKSAKISVKEANELRGEVERLRREVEDAKAEKEGLRESFNTELVKRMETIRDIPPEQWKDTITKALNEFKEKNFS